MSPRHLPRLSLLLLLVLAMVGCSRTTPLSEKTSPTTISPAPDPATSAQSGQDSPVPTPLQPTTPATSSPSLSALPAPVDSPLGPSTPTAFNEMLRSGSLRTRWMSFPVSVSFKTPPTADDLSVLRDSFAKLGSLSPKVSLTTASSDANIEVYYLPKSRWHEIDMATAEMDTVSGYTQTTFDGENILSALIVIDDSLDQLGRNRTLVHELVHALGLGHNTCQGSLMFGGSGYDPSWEFSEYDSTIFRAWYSDDPGATLLPLPCPAVQWDVVNVRSTSGPTTTVWCQQNSNECYEVSPVSGPKLTAGPSWWRTEGGVTRQDPSRYVQLNFNGLALTCDLPAPLAPYGRCSRSDAAPPTPVNVSHWYDGKVIFTYDPSLYKAYSVENRRLLCTLPTPSVPYAPCQFTEGSQVSSADLYTDGQSLFKTKPAS